MIPSTEKPLLRPAVEHLLSAEDLSRAARRHISPAEKTNEENARLALEDMARAMGQLVAAFADLAKAFPKAAEGIQL